MAWQLTKISDQGTSNPIIARLHLGLWEVIQMAQLPKEKKEALMECSFEIGNDLVRAEKAAMPLLKELNEAMARLDTTGVTTQANGRVVNVPGIMNLDECRVFLKYAKGALQTLAKAMGLIFDKNFNGPHFHLIRDHAVAKLGKDHPATELLVADQVWIKEILELRNEDEHPKSGKPFIRGFIISPGPDGLWVVDPPRFFNEAILSNRLEVFSHNLLTFSEEVIALAVADFFPKPVILEQIPEDKRNPKCPVRFRLGIKLPSSTETTAK